jgi:hypothetical protein
MSSAQHDSLRALRNKLKEALIRPEGYQRQ